MTRVAIVLTALASIGTPVLTQIITVSPRPSLSIGQVDGDPNYLLNNVGHVRKLSDGRIMITMGPDIRFYDSLGRHVSNAGGRGRGPGDFSTFRT